MDRRLVVLIALGCALLPPSAVGATDDLTTDPRERGALLALPAVYQLSTEVSVEALVTDDGRRIPVPPGARRVGEVGTAFGVAPGGHVVAATHVAEPFGESLAVAVRIAQLAVAGRSHGEGVARAWVREQRARAVGVTVVGRRLSQADAGGGRGESAHWTPRLVRAERDSDLALLRIPEPDAPALALDESRTIGTPIATIGYGGTAAAESPLAPAVKPGELGRSGTAESRPGRTLLEVTTGVEKGDSGGPAVDPDGNVHGVVVLRSDAGGIVEPAAAVRTLLAAEGLTPESTPATGAFTRGMSRFWALDFEEAARDLAVAEAAFPAHTLASRERARAETLSVAAVELAPRRSRTRGFLLAFGTLAAAAALACGLGLATLGWNGLVRRDHRRSSA
ncbi:MAG: S1 family peptidase [Miltoncostaeaceae bacterium]